MQIRAFKARGFFVHWFTPVYTRLKHGYVDFSPRNPRRSLPAYVSLNQPRDIDSISTNTASLPFIDIAHDLSAWFSPSFFFIFFIFISFFFIRYLSLLLGLGSNYEGRDVARVGFKLCTRLRVIAARNWICFAWNRIDWLIEDWCRKSVPFWDVSRWYKIDIFQIKKFVTRKHSSKSWLYSISFRNLRIKYYHVRIVRDKNFS